MAHYRTRMARGERGVVMPVPIVRSPRGGRDRSPHVASRLGMSVDHYRAHIAVGEKWCSGHRSFHVLAATPWTQRRNTASGLGGSCRAWCREYQAARKGS